MLQSIAVLFLSGGVAASTFVSTVAELQSAISDTTVGRIIVSAGTYALGSVSGSTAFQVWNTQRDLTIEASEPGMVVLDGEGQVQIFNVHVGSSQYVATLVGLNITRGSGEGSAVKITGGALRMIGCAVHHNGGQSAIYASKSGSTATSLNLERCHLHNNAATSGGGAMNLHNGPIATLEECLVTHNTASWGGAFSSQSSYLTLTNCDVSHNTCTGDTGGGAIYHTFGSLTMMGTSLTHNAATHSSASGGAFKAHPADVTIVDGAIMYNTCGRKGAAFYAEQGTWTIRNTRVEGNSGGTSTALGGYKYGGTLCLVDEASLYVDPLDFRGGSQYCAPSPPLMPPSPPPSPTPPGPPGPPSAPAVAGPANVVVEPGGLLRVRAGASLQIGEA